MLTEKQELQQIDAKNKRAKKRWLKIITFLAFFWLFFQF